MKISIDKVTYQSDDKNEKSAKANYLGSTELHMYINTNKFKKYFPWLVWFSGLNVSL